MAVLDYYSHHGSMHTLPLTTRTGRATSQVGGCLGISSPMCILPNFDITLATQTRWATTWVGIWKSNMTSKLLEPLHARMNSLLVCNLNNKLYEVSDVYWFVFWCLWWCCHLTISRLIAGGASVWGFKS